ncbi:MAG TPA: hypothetical protein DHW81_03845, partial [Nitrospiraceae bacterium]|nr:hypothetical protein [Nitrospiraceae bacterium]
LLGRNTVVIGAVVIIIVAFGLGYFFGYKGGEFLQSEKDAEISGKDKAAAILEEKKVLDAASADKSVIPPPIMPPSEFPQENKAQKPSSAEADKGKEAPKEFPAPPPFPPEPPKEKEPVKTEQAGAEQPADKPQPAEADVKAKGVKPAKKDVKSKGSQKISKTSKNSKNSHERLYAVQFGAFPSKEGAEQLQAALKSKGIKAYIVERSEGDPYFRVRAGAYKTKKEAGSSAVSMQKKTGMQNFVTAK